MLASITHDFYVSKNAQSVGFSDEDVISISESMDEAHELGLFSTVKCALIGAECSRTHIVSVAVHPGFEERARSVDLYSSRYLDPCPRPSSETIHVNDMGVCIRRYPVGAPRAQPYHWSIFRTDIGSPANPTIPRNRLFDSFKCGDAIRTVRGNILVVKSSRDGLVTDVLERDLFFVERLVYRRVRFVEELLAAIALYIPLSHLQLWRFLPEPAPTVSRKEVRNRLLGAVSPYLRQGSRERFYQDLRDCRGALVGGVPLDILLWGRWPPGKRVVAPFLEVVVHCDMSESLHDLFLSNGYSSRVCAPPSRYGSTIESAELYTGRDADGTALKIYLYTSKDEALDVVLSGPTTAHMNAVTPDHVVSFYPGATYARSSILRGGVQRSDLQADDPVLTMGLEVVADNGDWKRECSHWCPMARRKTYGDEGVATYRWYDDLDTSDTLSWGRTEPLDISCAKPLAWQLSRKCMNTKCNDGALRQFRAKYVIV
ncbi:hypothetical protein NMY22_g12830 [Coprinellus aureogranulatus]|nr:hypothetical protein NMY22_g12830 [Coprinellus aureogranulatus]